MVRHRQVHEARAVYTTRASPLDSHRDSCCSLTLRLCFCHWLIFFLLLRAFLHGKRGG